MSGCPVILSVAEAIPGPPVSSTDALTVTDCVALTQPAGTMTEGILGPCSAQAPFTHASATPQMLAQAYSHCFLLLQKAPASCPPSGRAMQSLSVAQVPTDGFPL